MRKLSILLLQSQIPFSRGGAEILFERLNQTFREMGHSSDILSLPFAAEPKSELLWHMTQWRSLSLEHVSGRHVDVVIAGKFPTYYAKHPCKIVWLIHQHRQAYELVGSRYGDFHSIVEDESIRSSIIRADKKVLEEAKAIFTISDTVSKRLLDFNDLESIALEPPVPARIKFRMGTKGSYILSVGRLCSAKRPDLIIRTLPLLPEDVTLKIIGLPDEPNYESYLRSEVAKHHLTHRVEFLGQVSEERLIDLYADSLGVYYGPYDEDYGFVTFEAAKSGKPIVTTVDSGYVKEVVERNQSGLIVQPLPEMIAGAFISLINSPGEYDNLSGNALRTRHSESWVAVAETLLRAATNPSISHK